jgi:hypothetical protein
MLGLQVLEKLLHLLLLQSRIRRDRSDAGRLHHRGGVVAHAEVALDGALHARLGQPLRHDAGRWLAGRHGVHIGGGPSRVDDQH